MLVAISDIHFTDGSTGKFNIGRLMFCARITGALLSPIRSAPIGFGSFRSPFDFKVAGAIVRFGLKIRFPGRQKKCSESRRRRPG